MALVREVVDEANSVAAQRIPTDSHISREAHNLFLIDDKFRLKALLFGIRLVTSIIRAN